MRIDDTETWRTCMFCRESSTTKLLSRSSGHVYGAICSICMVDLQSAIESFEWRKVNDFRC